MESCRPHHRLALLAALISIGCGTASTEPAFTEAAASSVVVGVQPTAVALQLHGQQAFAAAVTGAVDTAVTWSIQEGSAGGTVTGGAYSAPGVPGTFHVVATSVADPTKAAVAEVTVTAAPPPPDTTRPAVTAFAVGGTATPLPVTAFAAVDDSGVSGYLITESSTPPAAASPSWQAARPASYATLSTGTVTLYPWARDAAGNVSLVYGAPAAVTLAAPTSAAKLGTNLNWCTDWDPEKLPADLMWSSRPWATGDGNGGNAGAWAPVDDHGWPVVPAGTRFGAIFEMSPWPGTYRLTFTNRQGASGDTVTSSSGNVQVQNRRHDAVTNVTSYDVVVPTFVPGQFIWLMWAGSTGGVTDVHLMRPLQDGSGWHAVGTALSDHIIDRLAHFSAIRTMQTQSGSSDKSTGRDVTWAGRTRPWSSQQRSAEAGRFGGVAIENLIAMANQANKDLWINVPFLADDAYIRNMALTLRYGSDGINPYTSAQASPVFPPLEPDLVVYVEHGNEIWNSGSAYWEAVNENLVTADLATTRIDYTAANVPTLGWRRTGYLAARMSVIFRQVWGDAAMMTRVRPVLATQHGRYATSYEPLWYLDAVWGPGSTAAAFGPIANPRQPVSYYLYGLATAPYIPSGNDTLDPTSAATLLDGILANLDDTTPDYPVPAMARDQGYAASYGLQYLAYEGGDNLIPELMPGGATAATIQNAKDASFHPVLGARMGANIDPVSGLPLADQRNHVYGRMFSEWAKAGGGLFMHFTLGEAANAGSMFGLCAPTSYVPGADPARGESSSDCRHEVGPKWDAVKAFARAWGP